MLPSTNDEAGSPSLAVKEPKTKARWLALDLLRFVAVLLMVQGHVFTALLDPSYASERWFRHHNFVHGYTAPMFLFAAGLAFGYTTFRAWDANTTWGPRLQKRLRRYGWLLVIGYWLHMPSMALSRLLALDAASVEEWLRVDVLQHIGVSLACMQLVALAVRRQTVFIAIVSVVFLLVVFSAPIVWAMDLSLLPAPLAAYVNSSSGSLFPLVPWAGFTYAGILIAYAARNVERPSRELAWPFLGLTIALFVVPIALNHSGLQLYGRHNFWRTDPYYFFFRLANVLLVLTVWCFVERWADARRLLEVGAGGARSHVGRFLSFIRIIGAETLIIYVAHLLILHGSVLAPGFNRVMGSSLSLAQASVASLVLFVVTAGLAWAWQEWRKGERRFRVLQWSAIGVFAVLMLATR